MTDDFTEDDTGPRCYMAEDGEHFWFDHKCSDVRVEWGATEYPPSDTTAAYFQEARNHTMLPLGRQHWTVVTKEPLTVSPSILCWKCGLHGFWREGKWVGA